ncbi:MAG: hypothetical protein PHN51_12005 [Candidatus Nanopelagicales bacterium]|nr:hypothetical protein [Candidatus Nanopelagicales bacterium]
MGISLNRVKYVTKEADLLVRDFTQLKTSDVISKIITPLLNNQAFQDARKALDTLKSLQDGVADLANRLENLDVSDVASRMLGSLDVSRLGSLGPAINLIKGMDTATVNSFLRSVMGNVTAQLYENPALLEEFKSISPDVSTQVMLKALKDFNEVIQSGADGAALRNQIVRRISDDLPLAEMSGLYRQIDRLKETAVQGANALLGSTQQSGGTSSTTTSVNVDTSSALLLYKALSVEAVCVYYRHPYLHTDERQHIINKCLAGAPPVTQDTAFMYMTISNMRAGWPYTHDRLFMDTVRIMSQTLDPATGVPDAGIDAVTSYLTAIAAHLRQAAEIMSVSSATRVLFDSIHATTYPNTYPGGTAYSQNDRFVQYITVLAKCVSAEGDAGRSFTLDKGHRVSLYVFAHSLSRTLDRILLSTANLSVAEKANYIRQELRVFWDSGTNGIDLHSPMSMYQLTDGRSFGSVAYSPLSEHWALLLATSSEIDRQSVILDGQRYRVSAGFVENCVALLRAVNKPGLSLTTPSSASDTDRTAYQRLATLRVVTNSYAPPTTVVQTPSSGYTSVVGPTGQATGFKSLHHPDSVPSGSASATGYVILSYIAGAGSPERLKFFFPPGTAMFTANFLAYLSPMPAKGVMKFRSAPTTQAFQVTDAMAYASDNSGGPQGGAYDQTILANILAGRETFFFGNGGAGLMSISYGGTMLPGATQGGYVYCNFQYPGGTLGATQWSVYVDRETYTDWYNSAIWDSSGNPSESADHSANIPPVATEPLASFPDTDPRHYLTANNPNPNNIIKMITGDQMGLSALKIVASHMGFFPVANTISFPETDSAYKYNRRMDAFSINPSTLTITATPI